MLEIKESQKTLQIGDFYGNAEMAIISEDEKFCAICGCGIIVYFFQEPFEEYEYHKETSQWKEWGRKKESEEIWIENIKIENENGEVVVINVYQ